MSKVVLSRPVMADILRKIFSKWQGIRGIPRLLWWLRRLVFPPMPVFVKSPDGLPFMLNREDYGQVMLYYFRYCPELLALISDVVKPGNVCLDLGANVGLLAAHMAKCVGANGRVVAVEPNPPVFTQLRDMIERSFPGLITPVAAGIAEKDTFGDLYIPKGGFSESVEITNKPDGGAKLELLGITSVVQRYLDGQAPDFIKVDIEGNEAHLIESMSDLFRQWYRPILLVEFHPQKCLHRGIDAAQVTRELADLGYQMKTVEKSDDGYRLSHVCHERMGHDNILFATLSHLSENSRLALKWSE